MYLACDFKDATRPSRTPPTGLDDTLALMGQMGVHMTFDRDEEIYGQDEDADLVYRVVKGAVRTSRMMSDGRRQVADFYHPGDLFGFETGPEHRFSAEALKTCEVLVLRRSALRSAGGDVERLAWAAATRQLDRAHDHVLLLGRKTACEKVASFLMDCLRDGVGESIDLPMGRRDMADYLGLTIETVSRTLSQLQTTHVVTFSATRRFRVTNLAAMARLAQ